MKFLPATILLAFVASLPISALPTLNRREESLQIVFPAAPKPLPNCDNQLLQIDRVVLSPNPLQPGQTLAIQASGTLLDKVEKGARVVLDLTTGLDTLWDKTVDLYDRIRDMTSHLNMGTMAFEAPVALPKGILPRKYFLEATVYIKDAGQATCRIRRDVYDSLNGEMPVDGLRHPSEI